MRLNSSCTTKSSCSSKFKIRGSVGKYTFTHRSRHPPNLNIWAWILHPVVFTTSLSTFRVFRLSWASPPFARPVSLHSSRKAEHIEALYMPNSFLKSWGKDLERLKCSWRPIKLTPKVLMRSRIHCALTEFNPVELLLSYYPKYEIWTIEKKLWTIPLRKNLALLIHPKHFQFPPSNEDNISFIASRLWPICILHFFSHLTSNNSCDDQTEKKRKHLFKLVTKNSARVEEFYKHLFTCKQMYWYTHILIYKYTDIQIYWYTNILMYKFTDIQVYKEILLLNIQYEWANFIQCNRRSKIKRGGAY